MREEQHPAAVKFTDLDPKVQEFLDRLGPDNVETLKYLAGVPKEELQGLMKFIRDSKAVGWFMKWAILSLFGLFLAAVSIGQGLQWFLNAFAKGAPPS